MQLLVEDLVHIIIQWIVINGQNITEKLSVWFVCLFVLAPVNHHTKGNLESGA